MEGMKFGVLFVILLGICLVEGVLGEVEGVRGCEGWSFFFLLGKEN